MTSRTTEVEKAYLELGSALLISWLWSEVLNWDRSLSQIHKPDSHWDTYWELWFMKDNLLLKGNNNRHLNTTWMRESHVNFQITQTEKDKKKSNMWFYDAFNKFLSAVTKHFPFRVKLIWTIWMLLVASYSNNKSAAAEISRSVTN